MLWSGITACLAVAILLWGRRWKRRGPEGRCSRCDQIVDGIASGVCPECGSNLCRSGAVARYSQAKHQLLVVLAALVLLFSAPRFAYLLYGAFTEPGWQTTVPAWWLSQMEMRLATGARLEQAAHGLLAARDQQRISDSQFNTGARRAFGRMLDSLKAGAAPSKSLKLLARIGAEDKAITKAQIATAIQLSTTVTQWTAKSASSVQTDPGGVVECDFLPETWQLEFEYDIKDANGALIENHGGGQYHGWDRGNSGRVLFHYPLISVPPGPGPYSCEWTLKVIPPGGPYWFSHQWTLLNPFVVSPTSPEHSLQGSPGG